MTTARHIDCGRPTSRRSFLAAAVTGAAGLALTTGRSDAELPGNVTQLSEHLLVYHGPINVGIVRNGDQALLIDCGDDSVVSALQAAGIKSVKRVIFTHYHRDQVCGVKAVAASAKIGAFALERELFSDPLNTYWNDDKQLYRVYRSFRPDHLVPIEPIQVDDALEDGDVLTFGPARLTCIHTPGHTEGSVSYVVEVDGRRVVFSGDCIYDRGQIWDIQSLQKGFKRGNRQIGGYHGFMGDRWRLAESLTKIKHLEPDMLVPSHGNMMKAPAASIDALIEKLETCYENYVSISALRHYFPELFTKYAGKAGQMPIRPGTPPPACLRHFGTTWMLVSETGGALVMDVGSKAIVTRLQKMLADGEIKRVEGLWVTHYHFDHTDGILEFQRTFDCPCITDQRLADVLTHPAAWRLPCLAPDPIRVHKPMQDGQSWSWHEFKLTSYFYPGQTRYHGGLLVEKGDLRMLFAGDSHTMAGIDEYCAHNRNWLGRDVGFQYCLSLIEKLKPTHIFNCHVKDAFTFTADEIGFMRAQLDRRESLFGELLPWDHANFGLDPSWVRADPYLQSAHAGDTVAVNVVITNHANEERKYACRASANSLGAQPTDWIEKNVEKKAEQALPLRITIPKNTTAGRYVIPIDIRCRDRHLPQFSEAIIDVARP